MLQCCFLDITSHIAIIAMPKLKQLFLVISVLKFAIVAKTVLINHGKNITNGNVEI
ncbi:hypothetical protein X975_20876, partial [Stegodyphus mimosarum]